MAPQRSGTARVSGRFPAASVAGATVPSLYSFFAFTWATLPEAGDHLRSSGDAGSGSVLRRGRADAWRKSQASAFNHAIAK
jgi:hypothetical protein